MGMSLFIAAFGLLIGNPVVGALINIEKKRFAAGQGFAGGVILLRALLFVIAIVLQRQHARIQKA